MNTCSQFNHPEAKGMCYAVMNGQLGDAKAAEELKANQPAEPAAAAPTEQVEIGKENPEAAEYHANTEMLRKMAQGA